MPASLADTIARLDRERFRGRRQELAVLERMLASDLPRVVHVHGPGGIGKSALLRELVRRAKARGLTPRVLDGREVAPVPGEIERALAGVHEDAEPLLVLDSYERMRGADGWLRSTLVPSLPAGSRIVLAGRRPPADEWFRDGWEHVVAELELGPLPEDDARALLAAHGVAAGEVADELVRWADGWPLALSVAASDPARPGAGDDKLRAVLARVVRPELRGASHGDALAVAAIARACDARLLAGVLPGVDGEAAVAALRGLSFAEAVGAGVTLHELVRRAVRAELEPRRAAALRRRIADHVHARAVAGEPRMLIDLTELIDDRALRWGFGAEGVAAYRIEGPRPEDRAALAQRLARRPAQWRDIERFLDHAPDRVVVARDVHDRLVGLSVAVTTAAAPAIAEEDAVLGRWLAWARAELPGDAVLVWRDAIDFERTVDPASPVVSLMNTACILDCGLSNVRWSLIPMARDNPAALRFSASVGGRGVPELTITVDGRITECHVIDHGDGGMLGQIRDIVYTELGLAPAPPPVTPETVRDALRHLQRPALLAASPLARGEGMEDRAGSVRVLLEEAARRAFGTSPEEEGLRRVLERGYLDPAGKHEQAAADLGLSRTAYFRRLREASDRVAQWLAGGTRSGPPRY